MDVEFTFQNGRKEVVTYPTELVHEAGSRFAEPPGRIHHAGRAFYWRGHVGGWPHARTELYMELAEGPPVCNRGCIGEHDPRCANSPSYAPPRRTYDRDELLDAALALVAGGLTDPTGAVHRAKELLDAVDSAV